MPSVDSPTYYNNSHGDAAQTTEQIRFFRDCLFDPDDDTGDVEMPLGHVTLVEVTWLDILRHLPSDSQTKDIVALNVEPGWYVIRVDSNGLVWAMTYGTGTYGEESARSDFAEAQSVASAWWEAEDNPS